MKEQWTEKKRLKSKPTHIKLPEYILIPRMACLAWKQAKSAKISNTMFKYLQGFYVKSVMGIFFQFLKFVPKSLTFLLLDQTMAAKGLFKFV